MIRHPIWFVVLVLTLAASIHIVFAYDIAYVRAPRCGDGLASIEPLHENCNGAERNTRWPEVNNPVRMEGDTDLVLLHEDGSEEILVDAGSLQAVDSPRPSLDATAIYYALCEDVTPENNTQALAKGDCNLWRIDLATRERTQLTHSEFDGREAKPSHGIYNLHPYEFAPGRIAFVTSRQNYAPAKSFLDVNLLLAVLDLGTGTVEVIGHLNVGSALHPIPLTDGRLMFSSAEVQGTRDARLWGLWWLRPDGSDFGPLMSAFQPASAVHFQTQLPNGNVCAIEYYNGTNNGFGTLLCFQTVSLEDNRPFFGSPEPKKNPPIGLGCFQGKGLAQGHPQWRYSFPPAGLHAVTPWANGADNAGCTGELVWESGDTAQSFYDRGGVWLGKVTHPTAVPSGLLVTHSATPANHVGSGRPAGATKPWDDGGIYAIDFEADGALPTIETPAGLRRIKNSPMWNEQQAVAVIPYTTVYGTPPAVLAPSASPKLEEGAPFGLVGSSSLCWHNADAGQKDSGWSSQGASVQKVGEHRYGCDTEDRQITALRVLQMEGYEPSKQSYKQDHWFKTAPREQGERLRILGEIPVRKLDATGAVRLDPWGDPDTSFLAKLPAFVPFTFQTLDQNGDVLNMSLTWHQLGPGEDRHDCGGCHAHNRLPRAFEATAAAEPDYPIWDLTERTPLLTEAGVEISASSPVDTEWTCDGLEALLGVPYEQAVAGVVAYRPAESAIMQGLTGNLRRLVSRWIAVGAPISMNKTAVASACEGGWFADQLRPTLTMRQADGRVIIGAFDAHGVAVSARVNSVEVPLTPFEDPHRWSLAACPGQRVDLEAVDGVGNITRLSRIF